MSDLWGRGYKTHSEVYPIGNSDSHMILIGGEEKGHPYWIQPYKPTATILKSPRTQYHSVKTTKRIGGMTRHLQSKNLKKKAKLIQKKEEEKKTEGQPIFPCLHKDIDFVSYGELSGGGRW